MYNTGTSKRKQKVKLNYDNESIRFRYPIERGHQKNTKLRSKEISDGIKVFWAKVSRVGREQISNLSQEPRVDSMLAIEREDYPWYVGGKVWWGE